VRKRKRDEEGAGSDDGEERLEKPGEGLKLENRESKKRKTVDKAQNKLDSLQQAGKDGEDDTEEQKRWRKAERKAAKRERKRTRAEKSKEKRGRQKTRKQEAVANEPRQYDAKDQGEDGESGPEEDADMVEGIDITGESTHMAQLVDPSSASPSPAINSPILSPQQHSGSSSVSSIIPHTESAPIKTPQSLPHVTQNSSKATEVSQSAKERLEVRLAELRAARKADGPDGRPARNRQELLEMRRKKEEERRVQKKEQRRKAKEEEARKQEEEIARRFSPGGSGSLLASPRSPMEPSNNFSFGRVAFGDGAQADATLSSVADQRKHKGAADPATALKAAQGKMSRLAGLDEAKRADIEQKDMWLNAKKRAHGERVRDDTSLLKKALKRQEGAKKKSEKEWQGRLEGVAKGQEIRQRKREDNLRKRKEEKGSKGKKNKSKKVKRPGFEGSFKGRTGGGKKTKA
jgi:Surfeit locus protein 6